MAILLSTKASAMQAWREALLAVDPSLDIRLFPDAGEPADIEAAVCWNSHDMAELRRYPNLKLLVSMGAGVDHLLRAPGPPPGVPVARLKDDRLTSAMGEWVLLNVLRFHRQDPEYRAQQAARVWNELPAPDTAERRIGILGLGQLGAHAAGMLRAVGFPVLGWTRQARELAGVTTYAGAEGLRAMLGQTDILVCLLPLTPETRGILNRDTFARLRRKLAGGPVIVNAARGGHQVETDIAAALVDGTLASASLDVFEVEPLPQDSPLWDLPNCYITPHIAAISDERAGVAYFSAAIAGHRAGRPLPHVVDRARGY